MNVEIYVQPFNGSQYDRLDLFDDEGINVKLKYKDLADVAKIYSTYSQQFSTPASDKNNRIFNYFFNTEVVKDNKLYIPAKIYVNKILFKTGFVQLIDVKLKNGRKSSYTINFFTGLTNFKDLLGDKLLKDVITDELLFDWIPSNIATQINTTGTTNGDVYVPLVSQKRVWHYKRNDNSSDNIWWNNNSNLSRYIGRNELRPAIRYTKIVDTLFNNIGVDLDYTELKNTYLKDLYVWANGSPSKEDKLVTFTTNFSSPTTDGGTSGWVFDYNTTSNVLTMTWKGGTRTTVNVKVNFKIVRPILSSNEELELFYKITDERQGKEGTPLLENKFNVIGNDANFNFNITKNSFGGLNIGDSFKFKIHISYNMPINFDFDNNDNQLILTAYNPSTFSNRVDRRLKITPDLRTTFSTLDVYNLLPEIKAIDFVSSMFRTFNINVIEDKFNPNKLTFISRDNFYTNQIVDYTPYIDISNLLIKNNNKYKQYTFTHSSPDYTSNVAYKKVMINNLNSKEYGQLLYYSDDKRLKDSYEVKTGYAIPINRYIEENVNNVEFIPTPVETFYGFTSDKPTNGEYTPNNKDFTIFYHNGLFDLGFDSNNSPIAFGLQNSLLNVGIQINKYHKFSIVNGTSSTYTNSLGYKDEVDLEGWIYDKNLFSNFYQNDIDVLQNPNTRVYEYNGYLPLGVVADFSLRNRVLIGDKKYSIEEADIDITTGKCKLILVNIAPSVVDIHYNPTAPTSFTATLI